MSYAVAPDPKILALASLAGDAGTRSIVKALSYITYILKPLFKYGR